MQYNKLLIQALLAITVSSNPIAPGPKEVTATYDDIVVVPAVPAANVITTYKGLNYTNFAVSQALAGIQNHSPPNALVTGFEQTTVNGGLAMITKANTTKFFDLQNFYYACAANTVEGAASVAQQCTFLVRGYRNIGDTTPFVQMDFTFDPAATNLNPAMVKATTVGFDVVQKIDFVMLESASGETLNVLVIDSLMYALFT